MRALVNAFFETASKKSSLEILPLRGCQTRQVCSGLRNDSGTSQFKLPRAGATAPILAAKPRQYHQSNIRCATATELAPSKSSFASQSASRVAIPIDGTYQEFSAILLRDLCQCSACVHESTKQKLYSTTDIPTDIRVRSLRQSGSTSDAVDIEWEGDAPGFEPSHITTLELETLRSINASGVPPGPFQEPPLAPTSWEGKMGELPDFDYAAYMEDDATLLKAIQQLQTHGLVFVTDVPGVEKSVSAIAERIGPVKDTFYGHTWNVRTVPKAINAAYTSNDLGFHTDLLYFQNPPHVQLLHCIQSSSSGGASVFADAFKAAADLYESDPNAFDVLATLPTNYHYKHPDSNLYSATKPVFDMRPLRVGDTSYSSLADYLHAWKRNQENIEHLTGTKYPSLSVFDCLEKINWGPPFLAPFSLQQESMEQARQSLTAVESLNVKMDRWHAAARKFSDLLHRPDTLFERLMKPGECVLFNNTRVLHSRRAFKSEDVGRARWLRGTYVDKDPFFSKLRVLQQKGGQQTMASTL